MEGVGEVKRGDLPWFAQRGWRGWGCEGVEVRGSPGFFSRGMLEEWGVQRENEEGGEEPTVLLSNGMARGRVLANEGGGVGDFSSSVEP